MSEKITYLDPNEVQTDERLQVRSIAIYGDKSRGDEAESLKAMRKRIYRVVDAGEHVDPIEVIKHGDEWLVFDGHNRLAVYQKVAEKKPVKIPVVVLPYTLKQALALGYKVNTKHGVRITSSDATKAAFRACVYSYNTIEVKEIVQQGISVRTAQAIRQAARKLIEESQIFEDDDENEVKRKVTQWCNQKTRQFARSGLDSVQTDHLGFPSYKFVLQPQPTRELSEKAQIEHMAKQIEKLVEQDEFVFLKALKKVSRKGRLGLPVSVKNVGSKFKDYPPEDSDF